jgi:hypothetical protein
MKTTILALSALCALGAFSATEARTKRAANHVVSYTAASVYHNDPRSQTGHVDGQLYGRATQKRMSKRTRNALIVAACVIGAVIVAALLFWAVVGLYTTAFITQAIICR